MKKIWKQLVTGLLMAGWMVVIFCFSAQPSEESAALSGSVAYEVVDTTDRVFRMKLSGWEMLSYAQRLDHPIRKAAHMTEYAILGLLSFAFYASLGKKGKSRYLLALVTAAAYAMTDEYHQMFVSGRGSSFVDVCIDTTGAAIGLLLLHFIIKKIGKHCEKKKVTLQ